MTIKQMIGKLPPREKFSSADAEARMNDLYAEKQCLEDLGFDLTGDQPYPLPETCRHVIRLNGWEQFCSQRVEPDIGIVREFYANLWPNSVYAVFVRERLVSLNPRTVNQLFNLINYDNDTDDFYSFLANPEACDRSLQEVTVPGTEWTISKSGNKTCKREALTDEAKIWFYFVRHSLMPTNHSSTLTVERVVLLSCIINGRTVNIGKLVCEQIRSCAGKKSGEMFFPTLICLLCRASGVEVPIEDDDFYPGGTITAQDLRRILPSLQPKTEGTPPAPTPLRAVPMDNSSPTVADAAASTSDDAVAMMRHMHAQLQIFWRFSREQYEAHLRSLPRNRVQAGNPWPAFPTELIPGEDPNQMADDDVIITPSPNPSKRE